MALPLLLHEIDGKWSKLRRGEAKSFVIMENPTICYGKRWKSFILFLTLSLDDDKMVKVKSHEHIFSQYGPNQQHRVAEWKFVTV